MTRSVDAGKTWAKHDVGFLEDDAVLDVLLAGEPWAIVAYIGVRDASWQRGERVTLAYVMRRRVALAGELARLDAILDTLVRVGLLDPDGRIPDDSWSRWAAPVLAHAEANRTRNPSGLKRTGTHVGTHVGTRTTTPKEGRKDDDLRSSFRPSDGTRTPANGASRPVRLPTPVVLEDALPPPRHASGRTWVDGKPCTDYDHAWTHVMTPAGMVCRTCDAAPD